MYQRLSSEDRIKARFIPSGMTEYKRSGDSVIYASPDHLHAIAYRGKAARHEWFYRFTSSEAFDQAVTRFFQSIAENDQRVQDRRQEKARFTTTLKPGDIITESWGYDQTNINFYQVIDVLGRCTVMIQEINGITTETGFMCGNKVPVPGDFLPGSVMMKKRVQPGHLSSGERIAIRSYSSGHKWDGKPEHCSWYA